MEISHLCRFSVVLISVFLCTASIITTEGDSRIIYVKEGSPFELTCLLTFFEWPKWQLEGRDLPSALSGDYVTETNKTESGVTSRLYVQHAHILHTGNYRCTAFRTDGHRVIVLSAAGLKANWDKDQTKIMLYHSKLILQCNSTDPTETDLRVKWSKDGIPIKANERIHINEAERKLTVTKTNDDDVGKYTCEATNSKSNVSDNKADIIILGRPYVKMQSELSVVEGTTLRLECHVWGHPKPDVKWYIGSNGSEVQPSSRVSFEPWNNVSNAVIIIKEAEMSDRASFNCTAVNEASKDGLPAFAVTTVRIKDKLAALWPFLGICAEVVVLCTIILIYEKKRNKTELDESDTDQSPEQKNTPDHGKDVRQRK